MRLVELLGSAAVLAAWAGPILGVLLLLNRRDRRETALWAAIGPCLTALRVDPELCGEIAVSVRASFWSGRVRVTLDLGSCAPSRVWPVVEGFCRALPRRAVLRVTAGAPERDAEPCDACGSQKSRKPAIYQGRQGLRRRTFVPGAWVD